MTNPFTEFIRKNIAELILGLAVGVIAVLLMDLTFQESMGVIVLSPLIAIILNQLLMVVVPNEKNQRTALIVLAVIGAFFAFQYFNLGIFNVDNVQSESFVEINVQPQTVGLATTFLKTITSVAWFSKVSFLSILSIGLIVMFLFPATRLIALIIIGLIGIPFIFLVVKNFTLILILGAMYGVASMIFKRPIRERALSRK